MDPTITTLVLYGVIWIGVYVVGRAVKAERFGFVLSPLYFMYKTTAFNEWIGSLASRRRRLWRILGNAGVAVGVGLMIFAVYWFGLNAYNLIFHVEAATSIEPVIPLPGLTISWESFPYLILAISLVLVTHELAHGIQTRVGNVPLKSAGVLIAVVLFGGFVEPDEQELEKASNETKLRVFAAGSFTNIALGLVFLLLFANFAATISPFYTTNYDGVEAAGLLPGFPAETAGMHAGDVIVAINGVRVHTIAELQQAMRSISPETPILVSTQRGDFALVTKPDPKNSSRGIMGVSPLRDVVSYTGTWAFLPNDLPYHLIRAEFWASIVFVSVGVLNMLPLYPFDGDRFLVTLLNAVGTKRAKDIRTIAMVASLGILGLNFVLSILRFGFIKL
jgi:membrane-associated protease RseP (regulator of RpoE activity)